MTTEPTSGAPTSGGEQTPPSEENEARETRWVALFFDGVTAGHWLERQERFTGTRRDAEKAALAIAAAEQGIVVVPESSWKPKVAEPPREPRIADFDPWQGAGA